MRRALIVLAVVLVIISIFFLGDRQEENGSVDEPAKTEDRAQITATSTPVVTAEGLEIPWDIGFLPDGRLLVTERPGRIIVMDKDGKNRKTIASDFEKQRGEGGLLGLTLHPNFAKNAFVYIYLTGPGANGKTANRVERYVLKDDKLTERKLIISGIPGAIYHDGGRMEFGPDGLLYIATGDATSPEIAQDKNSLGGKILRLTDEGTIPPGNPFGTAIYSFGHRNPQGLAWDEDGALWITEHGPTGEGGQCCRDEINKIKVGGNYGWPSSVGDTVRAGTIAPALHSGTDTWAPASLVYLEGKLYFGGLRGEALYEATLENGAVKELKKYLSDEYGRIRTVRLGSDGMLYITTSNRDGRGSAKAGDDKIIRIDPRSL